MATLKYKDKDGIIKKIEIPCGGSAIKVDSELSAISENPVQNKVITTELNKKIEVDNESSESLWIEGTQIDDVLSEESKNPVQNKVITAKLNEVFQSVSDGKSKIAAAITDKGINTAADATFNTMSENIKKIETGSSIQKDNTKISYNKVILNTIECTVEVTKNVD